MPNTAPQAVALIRAKVADWSPPDQSIADSLNTASLPNPSPQGAVPVPLSVMALMGQLSAGSLANLEAAGLTVKLCEDARAGDRASIGNWAVYAAVRGHCTAAERDSILAAVAATQPDPGYQPQLSWAVVNVGRPVDAADVAAARPAN